jgi:uncharacterized protein YjbI with pentapeptide repeats
MTPGFSCVVCNALSNHAMRLCERCRAKGLTAPFDLSKIQQEHTEWLTNRDFELDGSKTRWPKWNRAHFTGMDLRQVDLSGMNFQCADFKGVNLSGVNWSNVDLSECDFTGTNLSGATFTKVNLRSSYLIKANLSGLTLVDCNMEYANLFGSIQ